MFVSSWIMLKILEKYISLCTWKCECLLFTVSFTDQPAVEDDLHASEASGHHGCMCLLKYTTHCTCCPLHMLTGQHLLFIVLFMVCVLTDLPTCIQPLCFRFKVAISNISRGGNCRCTFLTSLLPKIQCCLRGGSQLPRLHNNTYWKRNASSSAVIFLCWFGHDRYQ